MIRPAAALAVAMLVLACAPATASAEPLDVDVQGPRALGPQTLARSLPGRGPAAVSLDVRIRPGSRLVLFGSVELRRKGRTLIVSAGKRRRSVRSPSGAHHIEALTGSGARLSVDGVGLGTPLRLSSRFQLAVAGGGARLESYLASPLSDRRALLLHRLASLHAVTPRGRFPLGVGADGTLRFHGGWTRGFWPGALWQADDLAPENDPFGDWALEATIANFGGERTDTHDLGFMYERSSIAAYERLCRDAGRRHPACEDLRDSALTAADALAALARTNPVAGMIPTRSRALCRDCTSLDQADTIVDSMMNTSLLLWAAGETPAERGSYRDLVVRHADAVAANLVRPDGSTAQSVHVDRRDGSVLMVHTHQGVAGGSTWARGQGWGVYGFTETAVGTRSARLLDVAERLAGYVATRNPGGAVPPYDYDAPPGAPTDTSAGVITAAGLLRLEQACRRMRRCDDRGRRWGDLGERMLESSLAHVRTQPPLGMLEGQVHSLGGSQTWDDSGEFIFGLDFALEGVRLAEAR